MNMATMAIASALLLFPDFVNVSPKNFLRTKERYVDGVS